MKRIQQVFLTVCAAAFVLSSCSSDDDGMQIPGEQGHYIDGTFVLNEGNSNPATASISFIGDDGSVINDIYRKENPGADETGSYLQNLFFDDERAFIVSGQANSVTVVDRYSFERDTTLREDFENPRYGTVVGDHAYVTNYADYSTGEDDFMTVIDLKDYSTKKINLNNWSEKVLSANGKIYIANGYYGDGNSISIFDPSSNSVEKVIDLGEGNSPNSFEEEDGKLYVLTSNYQVPGKLFTIDMTTETITQTIDIPETITGPDNLQLEDDMIYFTAGASVYSLKMGATAVPETPLLTYESNSEYGVMYGFAVEDGSIYIADGGDLASDSKAYKYSLDGNLEDTYAVGVGPNGFYRND